MSKRIERVNELIKRELGKILFEMLDVESSMLVTVTRVETTPNLLTAKVWVSVFPEKEERHVFAVLEQDIWKIQQALNKRLRMKPIPKIIFVKEGAVREAGRIEETIEKLKNNE